MSIQIGTLHKKSTLRRLDGSIINLKDEADGGDIIRNGRVVNEEKFNEIAQREEDKKKSAQAVANQVESPNAHLRNQAPDKNLLTDMPKEEVEQNEHIQVIEPDRVEILEKKVEDMDSKLDAILNALNK